MATMTQKPIQLVDLNEELARLWNSEQGQKRVRASLFNLILYAPKTSRSYFCQSLIKSVISKFPCRVILILEDDPSTEEYLRTSVTTETLGQGENQVFCEIIRIEVAGKLIERVPFIILPQILPDLPVYLLWTQDPTTDNTIMPHLEPFAHRIIFDSESAQNLQRFSQSVLSLMERFHCAIGDLNWSALAGWRNICAQVFNNAEIFQSLVQTKIIKIQYIRNPSDFHKHTQIEAAYLQAWIASKLNWKFLSLENNEGNIRLTYRRPLQEVVILLIPQEIEGQTSGSIVGLEIESVKNKGHFIFKKHPQSRQVFIQYSERDFCHVPYSSYLIGAAAGQEIVDEIFYPSGGRHYRDMLHMLATIPWSVSNG